MFFNQSLYLLSVAFVVVFIFLLNNPTLSGFCCLAISNMSSLIFSLLQLVSSCENHIDKVVGASPVIKCCLNQYIWIYKKKYKKIVYLSNNFSEYCNKKTPQSYPFCCLGKTGQITFISELSKVWKVSAKSKLTLFTHSWDRYSRMLYTASDRSAGKLSSKYNTGAAADILS